KHAALFFAVALAGAGLDLLTKHLAFEHIQQYQEVTIVDGFFAFGRTTNPGVVFGYGAGAKKIWLAVSVLAVPVILGIFFTVRKPKWILSIALGMIMAGTLGNMYDRVFTQKQEVRDFIKFYYRPSRGEPKVWPLFNLADSFICVGVFLLTVEMMFFDEKYRKPDEPAKPAPPVPAGPVPGPGPVVEGK
ncbi:MAG TPA: signal peptidase II, partial [Planctomycetota bacterium]|nr:signal peptidase II [Planctomycetota bacterium]